MGVLIEILPPKKMGATIDVFFISKFSFFLSKLRFCYVDSKKNKVSLLFVNFHSVSYLFFSQKNENYGLQIMTLF